MKSALDLFNRYRKPEEQTTISTKPIAYYCDAVAGAGKTYNGVNLAALLSTSNSPVIFCQPSLELINETCRSFEKQTKIKAIQITSNTTHTVGRCIAETVAEAADDSVLVCTHTGLFNTKYWTGADKWTLFFDEAFEPVIDLSVNIANSEDRLSLFDDLFDIELSDYPDQYQLIAKDSHFVREVSENRNNDAIYKVLQELCQHVSSSNWDVYVETESYERFINREYSDNRSKLIITAAFKPGLFTQFKQVIFLGAMIRDSFMCKWFESTFEFKLHKRLQKQMRYTTHNDPNVTINYVYNRDLWSKNFYNKEVNGRRVLDFAKDALMAYMDGEQFVCHMNKDSSGFDNELSGYGVVQLEHIAHGLNKYQHIEHYANIGAYNAPAQFTNWLKRFDGDESFRLSRTVEHAYQGIMRTSLRNPNRDKTRENKIVVASREMADKLALIFPNAKVQQLPGDLPWPVENKRGPKKKFNSNKDRYKAANLLKALKVKVPVTDYKELGLEEGLLYLTCFKAILRDVNETEEVSMQSWEEFVEMLGEMSQQRMNKDENILLAPAVYRKRNGVSTKFGRANVAQMSDMLFFDVDDGHLEIDAWSRLFPKTEMVIYSSAGYKDDVCKYRVIIKLDRSPSIDEYMFLLQQITIKHEDNVKVKAQQLGLEPHERNGYTGIDRSKLFPESIFYAPQLPVAGGDGVFMHITGKPLCVDTWLERFYDAGIEEAVCLPAAQIVTPNKGDKSITAIRAVVAANAQKAPRTELQRVLDAVGPGNRFESTQKLFAICRSKQVDLATRQWLADAWGLLDPDKKRARKFSKDILALK